MFKQLNNLLPYDGELYYLPHYLDNEKANQLFDLLFTEITWQHDRVKIFGKTIITKRKTAWYGDKAYDYPYSNQSRKANTWSKTLLELKKQLETDCKLYFNSCLLNLYHNGAEGMSWHSDNEKQMQHQLGIVSLSLGAERIFQFKHRKSNERISLTLKNGSLLLMQGATQHHWLHQLPIRKNIESARINLTFRNFADK